MTQDGPNEKKKGIVGDLRPYIVYRNPNGPSIATSRNRVQNGHKAKASADLQPDWEPGKPKP
jgi:hypothetical protein